MACAQKKVGLDLTEGSIAKALLVFAIPIILTNLLQQFYSMADLMVIGQYVGNTGTVSVSTGGEAADLTTYFATALSTAGQIYIAQLAGAKDEKRLKEAAGTMITVMLLLSFVLMVGCILFCSPILKLLNCPQEAFEGAVLYMIITCCGLPFVFGYNAVCGLLRGMGESKRPLIFVAVAATVNIFLDILLVAVFRWGAVGTAIATVASQIGSFIAAFIFMYHRREQFDFSFSRSYFKIHWKPLRVMMRLGVPQLVRSISVNFCMLWVKANINAFGMVASGTYSVGSKIEKFMNVFSQGIDGASGAMIGQNLGARKQGRVKKTLLTTLLITTIFGILGATAFLLIPRQLFRLFTTDTAVIDYGVIFLRIMSVGCLVYSFSGTFKSIATGAGAALLCFVIGLLDGICRIAVCLFTVYVLGIGEAYAYFWGAALCQLVPGLMAFAYFLSGKWKSKKLLYEE